jgi:2,3-bisphosphoglycerate-independent phosphoglycerate mutase
MFGYDLDDYPDRAVLMALARGYPPAPGDVLFAARFASVTVHEDRFELKERFIRDSEDDCAELAQAISTWSRDGLQFSYRYCGRGDGLLTVRGRASPNVTDSDPLGLDLPVIQVEPLESTAGNPAASVTASCLNDYLAWVHQILSDHPINARRQNAGDLPINMVITKWSGVLPNLEPFAEKHGLSAAGIPAEEVVDGVQRAVGMDVFGIQRSDDVSEDLDARLTRAFQLFAEGYDFVNVHTKEPDAIAHWSDPARKRDVIAALDRGLAPHIDELLDDELVVAITGDHCTPTSWDGKALGEFNDQHSGEPVPILVRARHAPVDDVTTFGERSVSAGSLGTVEGSHLMQMLLTFADRTNVAGMRPTPRPTSYRPRSVKPLVPRQPARATYEESR